MNGYDWLVNVQCGTCGAREEVQGPREYVQGRRAEWCEEHDGHEFEMRQAIMRPVADETGVPMTTPEFMRVVPVQ